MTDTVPVPFACVRVQFQSGIEKIKRDIIFAASLYL
jgi:hypothetical protein